jgi:hypothetical protein
MSRRARPFPISSLELIELRREGLSVDDISARIKTHVGNVCRQLKILRDAGNKVDFPNGGKYWTDQNLTDLRRHFAAGLDDQAIGKKLHRTLDSVEYKRRQLGLKREPVTAKPMDYTVTFAERLPAPVDVTALHPVPADWDTIMMDQRNRFPKARTWQEYQQARQAAGLPPMAPTEPWAAWKAKAA